MRSTVWLATVCLLPGAATARAQPPQPPSASREPVRLAALQRAAVETDPRARQVDLQRAQTELRLENISAERLPSIAATAQAQYQSDVPTPPSLLPGGVPLFAPPKGTYDASLRVDQAIVDPTRGPRAALERAQLAEGQARVRSTLFALRQEVNEAFFAAALLQERTGALAATIADLDARLRETNLRVREGAALPADAASVEATLLQRRQDESELRASRSAALRRLSDLSGRLLREDDVLDVPDFRAAVTGARHEAPRARPEYELFARTRERLERQRDAAAAQEQPRLSAYATAGYGRPGLNFLRDQFEPYALGGVRVQWKAWTWGATGREREALALQQQITAADEAAFTKSVARSSDVDLTTVDRLDNALTLDERIIALREEIARIAEIRFREGAVTASEYLDRSAELLQARFARAAHGIEMAQAGARYLTTLGLEVP
jgi:outer membrane protein TolC